MRKVLSWVLVLAMVLTSFSVAFAAEFSDTNGAPCEEAVNVLTELAVIDGYEDGTFKPDQVVTRAEASKLIVAALGLTPYATGSTSTFTDMVGAEWAQGFVGYAESLGILKGDGNGKFRPSDTVTYNEMATIIVRALGYTDISLAGTWPANFVSKAKTLGIMDDITGGGGAVGANRGDVAIMLYNALGLGIGSVDKENNWSTETTTENGTTVYGDTMYIRLGVKRDASPKLITYNDAEGAATNITPYIGAYATSLVNRNKSDEIISLDEVKSTFLTGEFNATGSKFTADDVDYTLDGGAFTNEVSTSAGAVQLFKNGVESGNYQTLNNAVANYKKCTLSVKLSGKTIKEVYAILDWSVDAAEMIDSDGLESITSDKKILSYSLPKDDNDEIDNNLFILNGVKSLSDIAVDDVVEVFYSSKNVVTRVDVGTEVLEGSVTRTSGTSPVKYTIDGTKYEFAPIYASDTITPEAGDQVKAFMTYEGKVYKFDKLSGDNGYAIVIKTINGTSSTESQAKIRIMTNDGTKTLYTVDETENDVKAFLDANWAWTAGGIAPGDIVTFTVDQSGIIDSITKKDKVNASTTVINKNGYIDSKQINEDAVIFTFDGTGLAFDTDSDNYATAKRAQILDTDNVTAQYVLNNSNKIVAMVIGANATATKGVFGVITGWSKGENDYTVSVLGANETSYTASQSTAQSSVKNLYKFTISTAGKLSVETMNNLTMGATKADDFQSVVTANAAECETVTSAGEVTNKGITLDMTNLKVYVWDDKEECYVEGGRNDIRDQDQVGTRYFYDTDGEDSNLLYDIVLVSPDTTIIPENVHA